MNTEKAPESEIIIYRQDDGNIKIDVRLEDETVWLSQKLMAELFGKSKKLFQSIFAISLMTVN